MNPLRNTDSRPWLKLALLALIPVVVVAVVLDHSLTGVVKSRALITAKTEARSVSQGVFEQRAPGRESLRRAFAQVANPEHVAGATLWSHGQPPLATLGEAGGRSPANPVGVRSALAGASSSNSISPPRGPKLL